ncbi:MAG: glycosyltransferase [Sphingobacteriales bacterium]|nr:MAG: glycosyltransferase [Sphingobacteriales bacterium]
MLPVIILIFLMFSACYITLILLYRWGWRKQPLYVIPPQYVPQTFVSIVIPARNEANNIGPCITSLLRQNYPRELLEIIVVDDHSTDGTTSVVEGFSDGNITIIRLVDHMPDDKIVAYKKKALSTAITMARGELIITTDADCIAGEDWLKNIVATYEMEHPVMIVAPVDYITVPTNVSVFQSLDFMSMQGITGATHRLGLGNMCNGANLAFTREAYQAVRGYEGIDNLASGDDYLLMMKMQKTFPGRISYLKSQAAIMKTQPQPDWGSFLQQRIRWASKSGKYDDKKLTFVLGLVYLYNLIFLLLVIGMAFYPVLKWTVLCYLLLKTAAELYYLYSVAGFFNKRRELLLFPFFQPIHIMYIIVAGFLGLIGVYRWKGRVVK